MQIIIYIIVCYKYHLYLRNYSSKSQSKFLQQILQINVAKTYLVPLWFSRQITEQIDAKLPKRDFPSIRMSRFLSKKRDKNIYKMPNIKRIWHFIYSSRKSSLYSAYLSILSYAQGIIKNSIYRTVPIDKLPKFGKVVL